jgi:hypothetical protein
MVDLPSESYVQTVLKRKRLGHPSPIMYDTVKVKVKVEGKCVPVLNASTTP